MSINPTTASNIRKATEQLSRSQRGRNAMRILLAWLDEDGLGLDTYNQEAVLVLLDGAWGSFPTAVREAMRNVLASPVTR